MSIKKMIILLLTLVAISGLVSCNNINDKMTNSKSLTEEKSDITDTELLALFKKYSPTLDGAYAEGYSSELYSAYKISNPKQFIEIMSKCDIHDMSGIIFLFVGEVGAYNTKELETAFEELRKDKTLSRKEKYAVNEVLAKVIFYKETMNVKE